jgi:hypothetical protein
MGLLSILSYTPIKLHNNYANLNNYTNNIAPIYQTIFGLSISVYFITKYI